MVPTLPVHTGGLLHGLHDGLSAVDACLVEHLRNESLEAHRFVGLPTLGLVSNPVGRRVTERRVVDAGELISLKARIALGDFRGFTL